MNKQVLKEYCLLRKIHFGIDSNGKSYLSSGTAQGCLNCARIRAEWDAREGQVVDEFERGTDAKAGDVRLRIVADIDRDLDFGDVYSPKVNTDIPASRLEREEKVEYERANRDGIWGVQAQYFDGRKWQTVDSCYGFIGDDWKGDYEISAKESAMDAAKEWGSSHLA